MLRKTLIVVPRREKFKVHIDDHQLELATALEKPCTILCVYDIDELEEKIRKMKYLEFEPLKRDKKLQKFLGEYLKNKFRG